MKSPRTLVPSTSEYLYLEIVFQSIESAQAFKEREIKTIVVAENLKPSFKKMAVLRTRVGVMITCDQLQRLYNELMLYKRSDISSFNISAKSPGRTTTLAVPKLLVEPRPMLTASSAKRAGPETLSSVTTFNSRSSLCRRLGQSNFPTQTPHPIRSRCGSMASANSLPIGPTSVSTDGAFHPAETPSHGILFIKFLVPNKRKRTASENADLRGLRLLKFNPSELFAAKMRILSIWVMSKRYKKAKMYADGSFLYQ